MNTLFIKLKGEYPPLAFTEKEIDCSKFTIKGHASNLIRVMDDPKKEGFYLIDNYNAVRLGDIQAVYVQ